MTAPSRATVAAAPVAAARPSGEHPFPVASAELERVATAILAAARSGGATAAETEVSQAVGQSVTVRHGEVGRSRTTVTRASR